MKIGITERGDACLDLSWADKLKNLDGAVIISKNFTRNEFLGKLLHNKSKIILHATLTGLGSSPIEPNVPPLNDNLKGIEKLINDGFGRNQIVIRTDPLFLSFQRTNFLWNISEFCSDLRLKRIRFSFLDFYPHVIERFKNIDPHFHPKSFTLNENMIQDFLKEFQKIKEKNDELTFEACAEKVPKGFSNIIENSGCISYKDLEILGLRDPNYFFGKSMQRRECSCLDCKTELLNSKKRCMHKCVYCYWKD